MWFDAFMPQLWSVQFAFPLFVTVSVVVVLRVCNRLRCHVGQLLPIAITQEFVCHPPLGERNVRMPLSDDSW